MFDRHHAMEHIKHEHEKERKELAALLIRLESVDVKRAEFEEAARVADERQRSEELNRIRRFS